MGTSIMPKHDLHRDKVDDKFLICREMMTDLSWCLWSAGNGKRPHFPVVSLPKLLNIPAAGDPAAGEPAADDSAADG